MTAELTSQEKKAILLKAQTAKMNRAFHWWEWKESTDKREQEITGKEMQPQGKKAKLIPRCFLEKHLYLPSKGGLEILGSTGLGSTTAELQERKSTEEDPMISGFPLLEVPTMPQPDFGADEKCIPIRHMVLVTMSERKTFLALKCASQVWTEPWSWLSIFFW